MSPVKTDRRKQSRHSGEARQAGRGSTDFPVIAIGASAGGLAACTKLLDAWPNARGMAFFLVQHSDATPDRPMVALLASHTALTVLQPTDGMPVERDHLYIVPAAFSLTIVAGAVRLTPAQPTRGARVPFDRLLQSIAQEYGARAVCVVLSGTGADGSIGLTAIRQNGGFVVAQEPREVDDAGLPRNAMAIGDVNVVLPLARIPDAITDWQLSSQRLGPPIGPVDDTDRLPEIVALLQGSTPLIFPGDNPGLAGAEQKAICGNALSANAEFQCKTDALLTSKEELQSLNEELRALNRQLQETLERQRTTFNDLQNVLYSTDVATLFLDSELKIRFFTPATKALFRVIESDIGRPLKDLHSLATDGALLTDAGRVLELLAPVERDVETPSGVWCRRILPYRTHDDAVEGVVITFTDITEQRQAAKALEVAKRDADLANAAKSRFLAAASHDLRQPLQTLALLQGLLASRVEGTASERLVARLDETVSAMSGMLNTLLDINQIEAGVVRAEITSFGIGDVLVQLRDAFAYHAHAQGIALRVLPCRLTVRSDPRLLAQILRNLVSNALKYTRVGKVLLGCRRSEGSLRIEVWDTGVGIADGDLEAIFDEYYQLNNAARDRNRGLGLGLSIVKRLGALLDHRVHVRSRLGGGSVFSIEVPICPNTVAAVSAEPAPTSHEPYLKTRPVGYPGRAGRILVVEDDPELRELLTLILSDGGHRANAVPDGPAALEIAATMQPDLVLTDYNLLGNMDGLEVTAKLREALGPELPVIILTGDVSTDALSAIAEQDCLQLSKPVKPSELTQAVQELLPPSLPLAPIFPRRGNSVAPKEASHVIFIVDDDMNIREGVRAVLEDAGRTVRDFTSGESFLRNYLPGTDGCLLIDAYLPGIGGLELLLHLRAAGDLLPTIMITGSSDVPMAVAAMKAGAADFIEKPIAAAELVASIGRALERSRDSRKLIAWQDSAAEHIAGLTPRQRQIMDLVLAGHPSKNIAADLGISQRTVENHRASIMRTTGTKSLPALARLALAAAVSTDCRKTLDGPSRSTRVSRIAAE